MKVLVRKISSLGVLKIQMIARAITMLAVMIAIPAVLIIGDPSLIRNPYVILVLLIAMTVFGFLAYLLSVRPYRLYCQSPEVLVETDGEYLYIHGKKEAKIPLSDLDGTYTFVHLPFIYSNEFIGAFATHMLSEKYGDLDLEIPGYGGYKLRFVANVQETADDLIAFINKALNND